MSKKLLMIASTLAVLAGCAKTDDYKPAADISGEDIFVIACEKCHKPMRDGSIMSLGKDNANKDAIIKKIQNGSLRMPSFPNIQGEAANRVAEYVLKHSKKE